MPKKIFNSDLETSTTIKAGVSVEAPTINATSINATNLTSTDIQVGGPVQQDGSGNDISHDSTISTESSLGRLILDADRLQLQGEQNVAIRGDVITFHSYHNTHAENTPLYVQIRKPREASSAFEIVEYEPGTDPLRKYGIRLAYEGDENNEPIPGVASNRGALQGIYYDSSTGAMETGNILEFTRSGSNITLGNSSSTVSCDGELESNVVKSNQGYLTPDKNTTVTDPALRHTPSVYSRQELVNQVSGVNYLSQVQSLDTIPASLHANVGSVDSFNDYSHSAMVLRSNINPDASDAADAFYSPVVNIRTVALDSDAVDGTADSNPNTNGLGTTGITLTAQVGPWLVNPGFRSTLHVRPDVIRIFGNLEMVTGAVIPFTGAHTLPLTKETLDSLTPGMCLVRGSDGFVIPSTTSNSSIVVGIFVGSIKLDTPSEETPGGKNSYAEYSEFTAIVAAVGDTRTGNCLGFNVCNENGDIQPGDLLVTSSTPGYLMKQDDDIMRSKTVGKAMEAVTFDDNGQATGVYGYLYCG